MHFTNTAPGTGKKRPSQSTRHWCSLPAKPEPPAAACQAGLHPPGTPQGCAVVLAHCSRRQPLPRGTGHNFCKPYGCSLLPRITFYSTQNITFYQLSSFHINSCCASVLRGPVPLQASAIEANLDTISTDVLEQGELLSLLANR